MNNKPVGFTVWQYKYIKKAIMAESEEYCNGKIYPYDDDIWERRHIGKLIGADKRVHAILIY